MKCRMAENGDIFSSFLFHFLESRIFCSREVMARKLSGFPAIKHLKSLAVTAKILEYKDIMNPDGVEATGLLTDKDMLTSCVHHFSAL